jgi:hypothetical protein
MGWSIGISVYHQVAAFLSLENILMADAGIFISRLYGGDGTALTSYLIAPY